MQIKKFLCKTVAVITTVALLTGYGGVIGTEASEYEQASEEEYTADDTAEIAVEDESQAESVIEDAATEDSQGAETAESEVAEAASTEEASTTEETSTGVSLYSARSSTASLTATASSDFTYEVLSSSAKTIEITDYNGSATTLTIPSTINGYTVTSIGEFAFSNCSCTSIVIPEGVTTIGNYAFGYSEYLTSVTIPSSVTSMGEDVFESSSSLTDITVDSDNEYYSSEDGILYNKDKTKILRCPEGKTGSFEISSGVTSIGDYAFFYCVNLTSITIPDSVTSIGEWAFCECDGLTTIVIPSSVKSIGDYAFWGCMELASVTISSGVTDIGNEAFENCYSLTSITIPASVTSIGDWAFSACDSLINITVDSNNKNYSSQDGVFYNKNKTTLICYPGGKTGSFVIPSSVTSIEKSAFHGCSNLTGVTIPNSVTSIGEYAFYYCDNLTSITIPDSITKIEEETFGFCSSLTSITIPDSVTSIGEDAFISCDNLTDIYYAGSETQWNKISFGDGWNSGCPDNMVIHYAKSSAVLDTPVLNSTTAASGGISVSWSKVSGASGYAVYRKTSGGSWSMLTTTTSTSYTDKTATAGTTYYYTVRAYTGNVTTAKKNTYSALYWGGYNSSGVTGKYIKMPTISNAQTNASGTVLSWSKVSGATGYAVWRKTASGSWSRIGYTTLTSYTDTTLLSSGMTYYYTIRAYSGSYSTANANTFNSNYWSYYDTTGKKIVYLAKPTLNSTTAASGGISVSWSKVSGASGYAVYRKTSGGSWSMLTTTTSTSYTDKTAAAGTTYYYTVRAYTGNVTTAKKNTYSALYWGGYNSSGVTGKYIKMPTISSATANANGTTLSWSKVSGATGYAVWRKTAGGSWSRIGYTTSTSYTDTTSLSSGTTYYYTIRAYSGSYSTANANTFNSNYWSYYDTTGKKIVYLAKPTLGSAAKVSSGIKVTWSKVSNASGYAVYRKVSGGSWTLIGNTTSTSYTDTASHTSGTAYYYTVRAYTGAYATAKKNTYNALYWGGYNSTGVSVTYTSTTSTTTTTTTTTSTAQSYAEQVAELVNEQRTANGLSELTLDATLTAAAMERAEECAEYFSHTRPDGTSCFTILDEYNVSWTAVAENIAAGQTSPSAVMTSWMNSSGHAENILSSSYSKIGVGYYKSSNGTAYWVQIFTN